MGKREAVDRTESLELAASKSIRKTLIINGKKK